MSLESDLKSLGCGDIDATDATRTTYSHDASIFEIRPQVVVFPRNSADIQKLVEYTGAHNDVWITPRSAGTDMTGGSVGASVVMDMTRHMNKTLDISRDTSVTAQDGVAIVEPGVYYRDLEKATLERELQYPVYPASRDLCAVGGIVSNNAGGEKSLTYGQTVDWVISVRAVLADGKEYELGPLYRAGLDAKLRQQNFEGEVYRNIYGLINANRDQIAAMEPHVSKNSSGYLLWRVWDGTTFNLAKLICGSQGTLGVVTQATLGLVRPKRHKQMIVIFLKDIAPIADVVHDVLRFKPETFESFDDKTLWFTLRFLPDFVRIIGASSIVSLGLQFLPEAWMALRGGIPKLIVMAEFTGDDESDVKKRASEALAIVRKRGIAARLTKNEKESHKYWTIRRSSFNVIRSHTKGKRTTPFIDDFIVPTASMPEFLPKLYAILEPYHLTLTIAGHVGNGNFHIIPLMDLKEERTRAIIPELSKKVYELVLQYKGSITAEHNDGLIRGPYVVQMFGAHGYELFRQVKKIFDPKGIFNRGKKIDVDWNYAMSHLRTD